MQAICDLVGLPLRPHGWGVGGEIAGGGIEHAAEQLAARAAPQSLVDCISESEGVQRAVPIPELVAGMEPSDSQRGSISYGPCQPRGRAPITQGAEQRIRYCLRILAVQNG